MFVAGENSGDQHAARLIGELRQRDPSLHCFGFGGEAMAHAGLELVENLAQRVPIIGLSQAIRHYPTLRRLFSRAVDLLASRRPNALVLVDYPGFNLRLAQEAKKLGIPVIYYISPQVWAWNKHRLRIIADTVSLMLVILPFEAELYRREGVPVAYVGHPLLDHEGPMHSRAEVLARLGLPSDAYVVGLIPGSRIPEVRRHLPVLLEAAVAIRRKLPNAAFVIPQATTVSRELIENHVRGYPHLRVAIADGQLASIRSALDFALCKSGTSTLELALADVPMVIFYKVSLPTMLFAKAVLRIPWVGLVNIIANEMIVPELLQHDATPERLARAALEIICSPEQLTRMREGLARVRRAMGRSGASARAAEEILHYLQQSESAERLERPS
ncbi:MAG: lipid-A-disaccharide synthase [Candidatus Hydrogenedentota bacterium]|uniref:Lipid-A-disaccharide synthase n=1 Tax=Sumerlaea chitinivorans TaxID=2250252 RepID=A0A2Z4Y4C2_SUMC1|nr:Lipid-A-disaccharide synthase [Candidatus Sumerlaea chitinivorans]RMH27891.1 MAG: lipid-A-disaccharide synthase [Candidatus Hydrogenedentota bacterium]GIX43987.1 MAG: lipid-A-disaccharide synthase [Candidatus Sumerlaea sp.]